MKRLVVRLAAFIILATIADVSLAGINNLCSYRFLWPADDAKPGMNLVELKALSIETSKIVDTPLGKAEAQIIDLSMGNGDKVARAQLLKIQGRDDVLIFVTETLQDITVPTGNYESPAFALPALRPDRSLSELLNFKIETFATPTARPVPTTGPVVMFSRKFETLILSPLDNFMSAMQSPVSGEWRCGFGGLIEKIPAGTKSQFILVSGQGINHTFLKWGELVQKWHGHKTADPYADVAMSRLGYWTDNGSYYYYRTEPGKTYSQTLLAVKAYADAQGIPYGYFQLDSWWYPKAEIKLKSSHDRGGFLLWEPIPEFFPEGLAEFQKQLGLPLVAHNRYCSDQSPYCQKYGCTLSKGDKREGAYPLDPAFWDEIMDNAVKYGVTVYEQDWLYTHMEMIPWMRSGLHNAESWYDAMADAAQKRGLTMQLCMASPEFFMQNLKHPNETHARTSHDYKGGLPKAFFWPPFHKVGLFAYAVGLWPFKDNFQSTAGQRPTYNILPEANPFGEALIAALSGGPVGPSDKIGASDAALILRTCRKDGILLKPDRPATPIDIMFLYNKSNIVGGKKPWIVTTESAHEAGKTVYLAATNLWPAHMYEPFLTFEEAGISGKHLVYDYLTGKYLISSDRLNFGFMPLEKTFYYVLCPLLPNGMAVVGETGKFITLSRKRFPSVVLEKDTLALAIAGVPGEVIALKLYSPRMPKLVFPLDRSVRISSLGQNLYEFTLTIPGSGKSELRIE